MNFRPGQSFSHRLHPVVKLGWLLWGTVSVFVFDSPVLPWVVVGGAVGLLWASGVAPWRIPGLRVWLLLGVIILVTHALSVSEGDPIFGLCTERGLLSGVRAMGRLMGVTIMSTWLVTTTEPVSLACALMKVGLPYRWGFALVTALRLAPIFRVEAHHVYRAQLVRGVAYDAGWARKWWLILRHLCVPLLVQALRTAHSLSLSMEGRSFGLYPQRTYLREVSAGPRDVVAGGLLLLSVLGAVIYGLVGA